MELQVLPIEVSELSAKVPESKKIEVETILSQVFAGTNTWAGQVDAIAITGPSDSMAIEMADVARKQAKAARIAAEKVFDAKRDEVQQLKAEFDLEDKLWLKAKQVMQLRFKSIEEKAEWKANTKKRFEAEEKEKKTVERMEQVTVYSQTVSRFEVESMTDTSFVLFLDGLKTAYIHRIEQEKKEQEEREEAQRIEKEKIEAQRIENEKLKAEKAETEKALAIERQKAEKERAEKEALIANNERIERDRIKKEAELLAIEAAKKAEPIKKQLTEWVESFSIDAPPAESEASKAIVLQFEQFKIWAKSKI